MHAELSPTRGYLGGGNIAGILGISPFKSPLDEYLTITNEMPIEISPEKQQFFDDRRDLEPWAAKKFTRATGLQILRRNARYDDVEFDWAKAEIDFEPDTGEDESNGETKSVHPNAAKQWGDPDQDEEPPLYVTAQAMWGLGITRRRRCFVHALIGFDDQRIYEVHRDETLISNMRAHAARFWKYHVEPRRMPQPTTIEDLLRLYQRDSGRAVEADTETQLAMTELADTKRKIALYESAKLISEFKIKSFMRDATTLTTGGVSVATWKARADGVRVFRLC